MQSAAIIQLAGNAGTGYVSADSPRYCNLALMNITTLKHPVKFYLTLAATTLSLVLFGTLMLVPAEARNNESPPQPLPLVGYAFYALAAYTLYRYIKHAPRVTVNKETITVGKRTYSWQNIQEIKLNVKCNFPHLFPFLPPLEKETMALLCYDGTVLVVYDDMYSNAWQLKLFVQQVIMYKGSYHVPDIFPVAKAETEGIGFTEVAGKQLASGRGFALWFVLVLYIAILVSGGNLEGREILLIMGLLLLWSFSRAMHYFQVSRRFLVIRRHNLSFIKHIFRTEDIYMIKFESNPKTPFRVRVITKDFKSRVYPAATLHKKHFMQLKAALRSLSIQVEDELF